jgi:hypothetical protein
MVPIVNRGLLAELSRGRAPIAHTSQAASRTGAGCGTCLYGHRSRVHRRSAPEHQVKKSPAEAGLGSREDCTTGMFVRDSLRPIQFAVQHKKAPGRLARAGGTELGARERNPEQQNVTVRLVAVN